MAAFVEREKARSICERSDFAFAVRITDNDAGRGVIKEIGKLARGIGGVERQEDAARGNCCEIKLDGGERFVDLHGNAVARVEACLCEDSCEAQGIAQSC